MSGHTVYLRKKGLLPKEERSKAEKTAGFRFRVEGVDPTRPGPWQYEDYIPGSEAPVYVGVTVSWGRLHTPLRNLKHRAVCRAAGEVRRVVVRQGADHQEALRWEVLRLAELRKEGHKLANRTEGGDGHHTFKGELKLPPAKYWLADLC